MSKTLYFATIDNDIVTSDNIARIIFLVNGEKVNAEDHDKIRLFAAMMNGVIRELKNPSVAFLVKHGHIVSAVKAYRDRNGVTLREAHDAVQKLAKELNKEQP